MCNHLQTSCDITASMNLFREFVCPCTGHKPASKAESTQSRLMAIALQRFAEVKESMVMRFADGKSDITLVIWDFAGQAVCSAQ